MNEVRICEKCGAVLDPSTPEGLCPRCVIATVGNLLLNEPASDGGSPTAADSPKKTVELSRSDILYDLTGTTIGRYKLLQQIGEGGFGIVYMAEQTEPVQRKVALKIVKAGMDTREIIARFEAERQALALMDHPNIAQVLDGGTTETGRPYFVMELVRGIPLTNYCDQANLRTRERLELFLKVCRAVQHAHQKGVIHRDLKPSNVLVTLHDGEPVPKVIDFGVAKALGQKLTDKTLFTRFEQMLGTPAYMSPEQAALGGLDIDTRSDIYSLGVLLYELLTGVTPLDAETLRQGALDEIRRMIQETDPPKPSTRVQTLGERLVEVARHRHAEPGALGRLIRGDLDWITMKALEKDRRRRYETVSGLVADIERHLRDEPVTARPPSTLYRLQKVARRHRVAFVAGTAVSFTLVLGLAASIWQAVRATRAEREQSNLRKQAQSAQINEATQRQHAQNSAAESRSLLVRQYVANGNRLVDEGDLLGALPWFAQALKEEQDSPERAEIHRLRLASTLQQCPKLVQMWFHETALDVAVFSRDGSRVLTGADDGTARVWDATSGEAVSPLLENRGGILAAAFSPDGHYVATGGWGTVGVWEVNTGRMLFPFLRHNGGIQSVVFSPDGGRLLTASTDNTAQVWDAATGARVGRPMTSADIIASATFSPDGSRVVTSGSSRMARIWDANTGEPISPPLEHDKNSGNSEFSPDGKLVATGSLDGTARLWDAESGKQVGLVRHQGYIWSVAFSPDGHQLVTASADGTAVVWKTETGFPVAPPMRHAGMVFKASFSPDGRWVVTASLDGTARVWAAATGQPVSPPLRHGAAVSRASFSPDSLRVLVASGRVNPILRVGPNGTVRLWDLAGGESAAPTVKHPTVVHAASFTPDGQRVSTVSLDGTAYLWDSRTGRVLAETQTNLEPVYPFGFTADGRAFVQAQSNGTTTVLDFRTGRPFLLALRHDGRVNHAECSPDGRRMVTASEDHTARVWDALTGKPVGLPLRHEGSVRYAAFSLDGRLVVTASSDQTARVWDAATGEPVTPPLKHSAMVHRALFSPEGRRLLTTTSDGKAQIWALPTERRRLEDDVLLAQLIAGHQIDETGAYVPMKSGAMRVAWQTLRHRYPAAFTATREQLLALQRLQLEEIAEAGQVLQSLEHWRRAVRFEESNHWTEAVEAFSKAIEVGIPDYGAYWHRSHCYAQIKRFREAIYDANEYLWRWHEGSWQEGFIRILGLRGQYHLNLGEGEQAVADFAKAIDLDPGNTTWYSGLISACDKARQLQQAVDALNQAVRRAPQDTNLLIQLYFYRSRIHLRLGDLRAAETDFQTAVGFCKTNANDYNNLAWYCVTGPKKFQSPEQALPLALKAVELDQGGQATLNTLGVVYYRVGQFTNAVEVFERDSKNQDPLTIAYDQLFLAMSYHRLGEIDKAKSCYAKAAKWLDENAASLEPQSSQELTEFRAEAQEVLGIPKAN